MQEIIVLICFKELTEEGERSYIRLRETELFKEVKVSLSEEIFDKNAKIEYAFHFKVKEDINGTIFLNKTKFRKEFSAIDSVLIFRKSNFKFHELNPGKIKLIDNVQEIIDVFILKLSNIDIKIINRLLLEGDKDSELLSDLERRGFIELVKLIKGERIGEKEIVEIIKYLPDDDLFNSQILERIHKQYDYGRNYLYSIYEKIQNRKLKRKIYFNESEYQTKLENFFIYYIMQKDILEEIKYQYELNPDNIKVQLPLNPLNFDFEKKYGLMAKVAKILENCFLNFPYETLKVFRNVLIREIEKKFNTNINIVVSYDFDLAKDSHIIEDLYFDDWKDVFNKLNNGFFIFEGYYQIKDIIDIRPSWDRDIRFIIKDKDGNKRECIINRNINYFKALKLDMDTPILMQAYLHEEIDENRNSSKFRIYIIDIKVLKKFEAISVKLWDNHLGKAKLHNTIDGLFLYTHTKKGAIYEKRILSVPINLINIFKGQNELFYKIELDGECVIYTKSGLIDYIDNETTYSYVSSSDLKRYITAILDEYRTKKRIIPGHMFPTIGVFDINENRQKILKVVHPFRDDISVFGENSVQVKLIENIKERGIDEKGELAEIYHKIINMEVMEEWKRITILGMSGIMPYCYAIRAKLDIFPNLFIIGVPESGKSTILKIFMNEMYGTKMKDPDNIKSMSRLTLYATETTTPINFDDIDDMPDEAIAFIKSNSTEKGTRDRNTKTQQMKSEQYYPCFCGTANEKHWIKGKKNSAFRSRCFIIEIPKRFNLIKYRKEFEKLYSKIKNNKLFGFYFLEKGLEFIENNIEGKTNYEKFINLLKKNEDIILDFLDKNKIDIGARRATMYILLYTGLQLWNYIFKIKGLDNSIIAKYLSINNGYFAEIINNLEITNKKIMLEDIEGILAYWEELYGDNYNSTPLKDKNGNYIVDRTFITKYDAFARMRGYTTLKTLNALAELQNEILSKQIKPKSIRVKIGYDEKIIWGIPFYYNELMDLFRDKKEKSEKLDNILFSSKELDYDKVFNKIKELIDENKGRPLEKSTLIQIIDIEFDNLNRENIEEIINRMIKYELLYETKGYIKMI
ncbi:MAG: hypothetical protein ACP6IY_10985 [Promethearchaeia archaeon]